MFSLIRNTVAFSNLPRLNQCPNFKPSNRKEPFFVVISLRSTLGAQVLRVFDRCTGSARNFNGCTGFLDTAYDGRTGFEKGWFLPLSIKHRFLIGVRVSDTGFCLAHEYEPLVAALVKGYFAYRFYPTKQLEFSGSKIPHSYLWRLIARFESLHWKSSFLINDFRIYKFGKICVFACRFHIFQLSMGRLN